MKTNEDIKKEYTFWSEKEKMTLSNLSSSLDRLKENESFTLDTLRDLENITSELSLLHTSITWRIIHILNRGDKLD